VYFSPADSWQLLPFSPADSWQLLPFSSANSWHLLQVAKNRALFARLHGISRLSSILLPPFHDEDDYTHMCRGKFG